MEAGAAADGDALDLLDGGECPGDFRGGDGVVAALEDVVGSGGDGGDLEPLSCLIIPGLARLKVSKVL